MKKLIMLLAIIGLLIPVPLPSFECPGARFQLKALSGFQQLTVSTLAVSLTVPANSYAAIAVVESESLRYRDDGTDPTAAVGVLAKADTTLVICGDVMREVKFIRSGGSDSTLNVSYYGR